jgi:short subunit dehydrogenase-like uncharacterized protein
LLGALLPKPGAGPSPAQIERGWFRCEVVALTDDGRRARVLIAHRGDASNRATVRFVCESALCLALDPDPRPGEPRPGGVLTPATAFGESLAHRLRRAGVGLEVGV